MSNSAISFVCVGDISYPQEFDEKTISSWIVKTAEAEGKKIAALQFVFCDDSYLTDLNNRYLHHDTLTDIITFPYADDPIEAEIYISLERVKDNAITYNNGNEHAELRRVVIHGLLHMCGYSDQNPSTKSEMRRLEGKYLEILDELS